VTGIHATAIVEPGAELAGDVEVGAYSIVRALVRIGAGSVIGPHCVIEGRTTIGRDNRISQFNDTAVWEKAGMSKAAADLYLGAIKESLNSPNMVLDMRIPQNQYYQGVVLDTAVAQFLAGEISRDEAIKQISDRWQEKTDELGRDAQLAAYNASLGVKR